MEKFLESSDLDLDKYDRHILVYHDDCKDGEMAAVIAEKWMTENHPRKKPERYAVGYHNRETLLAALRHTEYAEGSKRTLMIVVDMSFTQKQLSEVGDVLDTVIIIDHHKTMAEEWGITETTFKGRHSWEVIPGQRSGRIVDIQLMYDINECGASLAWRYFYPDMPMPLAVQYTRDRDLWKWQLKPQSQYFSNFVDSLQSQYLRFSFFNNMLEYDSDLQSDLRIGETIQNVFEKQRADICRLSKTVIRYMNEHWILFINCPYFHASEVANSLCSETYPVVCAFQVDGPEVKMSFRSKWSPASTAPHARKIAGIFGGGGHDNAAGAKISLEDFTEMMVTGKIPDTSQSVALPLLGTLQKKTPDESAF